MVRANLTLASQLNEPVDPNDRFAYGWRCVKKVAKNGTEKMVQVPLTLEDILHPQEEDFRVISDPHTRDMMYLRGAFDRALAKVAGAYVLSDCRVAWDRQGKYGHGPDIAVIFNVKEYGAWTTFNVVKEKTKPELIVEISSPSTRSTDLVDKVEEYAQQGVPHYVIADAREKEASRHLSLIDYHLMRGGNSYYTMPTDDLGRVWLPEVKLWLGSEAGLLVCWHANGKRVKTIVEVEQAAKKERAGRIAAEKAKLAAEKDRDKLAARLKELEEQVRHGPRSKGRNGTSGK